MGRDWGGSDKKGREEGKGEKERKGREDRERGGRARLVYLSRGPRLPSYTTGAL